MDATLYRHDSARGEIEATLEGVRISRLNLSETVVRLGEWLEGSQPRRVATANLDFLRIARRNLALKDALDGCDLVTADGAPLVWLSRLTKTRISERVAGSDLVVPLVQEAARRGASVYLLGGGAEVAKKAAAALRERVPGLRILGAEGPEVRMEDEGQCEEIAERVRRRGPDLLLLALGCPKQELFAARYGERCGARVTLGVGATFDFLAGTKRRAPRVMQRGGIEWLFRLVQEPRRLGMRYLADAVFLAGLFWRLRAFRRRRRRRLMRTSQSSEGTPAVE